MVRRRSQYKQAEEDAMSRLAAVRCKWQDHSLPAEELTLATNLLIEAGDHRVLHQLLILLLEWVHSAPFPQALLSSPVLARLVSLLHCPAWPIQKSALQLLTAGALNLQPEDAANFAKVIMPQTYRFFNYISNPINCWPDNTQHMIIAQLVFTIVCPHPLYIPEPPSSTTTSSQSCASPRSTKRSKNHNSKKTTKDSESEATPASKKDSFPAQPYSTGPQSLCLAWDIVAKLLLRDQIPTAGSMCLHTDPFKNVPPTCEVPSQSEVDNIRTVNCYGCNLVDDTSLETLGKSCGGDPDASATFFALETLQYLLRHGWFTAQVFPESPDVVRAILSSLNSSSAHVTAAAAGTMCSIITHAPPMAAPVTCSLQFVWRARILADRCVQPDQVAICSLPLIHHISHVYPAQMCSSGLISVITKSVHAMRACMKSHALQYLMLAVQIFLEVSFYPEPWSAAALRGDVLGAALKAVKLTWLADETYSNAAKVFGTTGGGETIVSKFLQQVRGEALQCVHMIRSMCNLRDRPAMLDRLLHPLEKDKFGASDSGIEGATGRIQDPTDELKGSARSTGEHSARSSIRDSSGNSEGGWYKAGALYMTLLWQAEKNFSGAIAVERALAQGEGQLGGVDDKPFSVAVLEQAEKLDAQIHASCVEVDK